MRLCLSVRIRERIHTLLKAPSNFREKSNVSISQIFIRHCQITITKQDKQYKDKHIHHTGGCDLHDWESACSQAGPIRSRAGQHCLISLYGGKNMPLQKGQKTIRIKKQQRRLMWKERRKERISLVIVWPVVKDELWCFSCEKY